MARAFAEARRAGWLHTAPNPRVGALALKDGHVIGHGYHVAFGSGHAEEMALRDAGAWDEAGRRMLSGVVDEMVVTLEPCSSEGGNKKRPPCLSYLQQAGVRRVVVGAIDPNPLHQGKGLQAMEEGDVEVVHLQREEDFLLQNPAFVASLENPDRPWILLKWAASFDGRTAASSGASQWITGEEARVEVHALRGLSDAVVAGKNTVELDSPRLTARDDEDTADPSTARILIGAMSTMSVDHPLLADPVPRFWVEGATATTSTPDWWSGQDTLLAVPTSADGYPNLAEAARRIRSEVGCRRLLVEGGARIQAAFLEAGLADAVVRYEAPLLLHGGLGSLDGNGVAHPQEGIRLSHEERLDLGMDLRRAFLLENRT
jgi:diaminohydroxyphosphoribosylaminopyrimidine deaminase/5-amino-6-(5-phosphoribosylamino)uracil reductase